MNTHSCIKPACVARYESEDPEPYYCPSCNEQRLVIAKEIDAKMAGRPKKEVRGIFSQKDFVGKNGRSFFNGDGERIM